MKFELVKKRIPLLLIHNFQLLFYNRSSIYIFQNLKFPQTNGFLMDPSDPHQHGEPSWSTKSSHKSATGFIISMPRSAIWSALLSYRATIGSFFWVQLLGYKRPAPSILLMRRWLLEELLMTAFVEKRIISHWLFPGMAIFTRLENSRSTLL